MDLPHGDEAQHLVVQLELALELGNGLRLRLVLQQQVDAASLLADRIGELAHPPFVHLLDFRASGFEDPAQPPRHVLRAGFSEIGVQNRQSFVVVHDTFLWSLFTAFGYRI